MNFTAIFCCYVLLPYFASFVSPPQQAITCYAGVGSCAKRIGSCFFRLSINRPTCGQPAAISCDPQKPLENKYFNQKRDHFNPIDSNKWKQRYLIYDYHYQGNGNVFIQIGTNENITEWHMQNGRWFRYCQDRKALCVGLERRGYGDSLPSGNLREENLKYLNTEQTLADVAWFIYNFKSVETKYSLPGTLKWIAYGWSEEGALAAWLRMKYPHLVHAALALSAPLLARMEYDAYFQLIEKDMLSYETRFKNEIHFAYSEIDKYLHNGKYKELGKIFNFCDKNLLVDNDTREKNIKFMYFTFAQVVAEIMHYGNDDTAATKNKAIEIMVDTRESSIKKFAQLVQLNSEANNYTGCLQLSYNLAINGYKETDGYKSQNLDYLFPETLGNRTTLYRYCSEYGHFETFNNFFQTSITLDFFDQFCNDVFNETFSKALLEDGVRRTNLFYGGLRIVVSRVIFVYGSNDPYRKLGVSEIAPENCITLVLAGARHCCELDNYKSIYVQSDVIEEIKALLVNWINLS